jgi:serine/threonine protein kinase/tetratricopeptide (TPR) repeat protein
MMPHPHSTSSISPGVATTLQHPVCIGPFKILGVLGEGGMGVVYAAEQTAPIHRRVALKVIKQGMDTRRVLSRFQSERQNLARLNHQYIARVLEAGATNLGRPFFVMELVAGEPITDYSDRHCLSTAERLDLFIKVCRGFDHAHHCGIIHRDIKPSNILVTVQEDSAIPKIIDFGVAKATERPISEWTSHTEQGQIIGTPEYMSPEQAEMTGLDIDHRSDIYSLGVVLYELLVGALPFESSTLRRAPAWEVSCILREQEPAKPSTRLSSLGDRSTVVAKHRRTSREALVRELRGDLDWIVMKAIDKDRTQRYGTCKELAEDIRRHLDDVPVLASPPRWSNRARKFVRRRRRPLVAAVAGVLILAVAGFSAWSARRSGRLAVQFAEAQRTAIEDPRKSIRLFDSLLDRNFDPVRTRTARAYALRRANEDREAQTECEQIVRDHPAEAGPAHVLLWALLRDSDPPRAEQHLRQAEQTASAAEQLLYRALALGPEESEQAIHLLRKYLSEHSVDLEARWALAGRLIEVEDWPAALEEAMFLTKAQESTATYWNARGLALHHLGDHDAALMAFGRAITLRPDNPFVYLNRAQAYRFRKKTGPDGAEIIDEQAREAAIRADALKARDDCDRAIALAPDDANAYALRAIASITMRDLGSAEADCRAALRQDPNNSLALRCLAQVLAGHHEYAAALDAIEHGMQGRKVSAGVPGMATLEIIDLHVRGVLRRIAGRLDDALVDLDGAIKLKPDIVQLQVDRAVTRRFLGDDAGALADLDMAVKLEKDMTPATDEPYAWQCLLWTWEILRLRNGPGDDLAAGAALDEAARVAPGPTEAALVDVCRGTMQEAQILAAPAVKSDPLIVRTAHYYLGVRDLVEGRIDSAREHFKKCDGSDLRAFPEVELSRFQLERLAARDRAVSNAGS